MQKIRKAVFPVAGFGTRLLPISKAIPKEMVPVVDRPLIQHVVEEALAAGINEIILVTRAGKSAIEDHFDKNHELELALRQSGKNQQADMIQNILPKGVECIFVRQPEQLGLGHAILCAARAVGSEPFAVLLADDFIVTNGKGTVHDLKVNFERSEKTQLSVMEVATQNISKYGIISLAGNSSQVAGLVEKPSIEEAPSRLASIGRYILTPDIFEFLRKQAPGSGGEIQLADAINSQSLLGQVEALKLKGQRFDCGDMEGYLDAISHMSGRLYSISKKNI